MTNYPNLPTYELLEVRYWFERCLSAGRLLNPERKYLPFTYEQLIKRAVLESKTEGDTP